jgi:hypothetical protein
MQHWPLRARLRLRAAWPACPPRRHWRYFAPARLLLPRLGTCAWVGCAAFGRSATAPSAYLDHAHRRVVALQALLARYHHGVALGHTFGDLHTPGAADTNFDLGTLRHQAFAVHKHWRRRCRRSSCATRSSTSCLRSAVGRRCAEATRCRAGCGCSVGSHIGRSSFLGSFGQGLELLFSLLHHFDHKLATTLRHDGLLWDGEG